MRRLLSVFDGPTRPRDLSALFQPGMLAVWMCFLHATVGGALAGMLYYTASEHDAIARAGGIMGLGQCLAATLLLAFGVLFTLVIPMRAIGTLEMPRFGRYLDQLVLSGVAPIRLFGGRLVAQNAFGLLLVGGALPYAIFALSLGGVKVAYVLTGFVALFAYANVLSLATLAVGVFVHEFMAALIVIAGASAIYLLGLFPAPLPLVGALTPSSLLVRPFWEATGAIEELGRYSKMNGTALNDVFATLSALNPLALYLGGAAIVALFCMVALVLGPTRCLVHETSAFGEVVMDGDVRRAGVLRKRFILRRRSEVAFLYENTPTWVRRWEAPLRFGAWILVFVIAMAAVGAMHVGLAHWYRPREWYHVATAELVVALCLAAAVFTSDRATLGTRLACGSRRVSAATLDFAAFVAVGAIAMLATLVLPPWLDRRGWMWKPQNDGYGVVASLLGIVMPLFTLAVIQVYAAAQFIASRAWNKAVVLLSATGLMFVVWFAPWVVAMLMIDNERYAGPKLPAIGLVASLSPVTSYTLTYDHNSRLGRVLVRHASPDLAIWSQLALVGVLSAAALARRRPVIAEGAR